ncbi:MAG: F0F1 ATP synthase subunit epsilon [Nitrospinaceae bacterium]
MAKNLLRLSVVTPEKLVVDDEVDQVNVPGSEGDLGILYDHAPILTNLRPGQLSYEKEGQATYMVVTGGYLEVTDNRVTVLAETAEFLHEVDRKRAAEAKAKAETLLSRPDLTDQEFQEAQKKLFRAVARLENTSD